MSWHLINGSLYVKVVANTSKLYLVTCQTCKALRVQITLESALKN